MMLLFTRYKALGLGLLGLISLGTHGRINESRSERNRPHVIIIQGFQFQPGTDTVRVGESVMWKNQDIVPHTATSDARRFDSKTIEAKGSWSLVAKKKGRLSYHCTFHPTMKGVVVIR
jgi:plastocyanin